MIITSSTRGWRKGGGARTSLQVLVEAPPWEVRLVFYENRSHAEHRSRIRRAVSVAPVWVAQTTAVSGEAKDDL